MTNGIAIIALIRELMLSLLLLLLLLVVVKYAILGMNKIVSRDVRRCWINNGLVITLMEIIVTHFEVVRNDVRGGVGRGVVDAAVAVVDADDVALHVLLLLFLIGDLVVKTAFSAKAAGSTATRFPEDGADLPTELMERKNGED